MIYNFNVLLLDLQGNPIKDAEGTTITIGKLLANTLVNQTKGDAIKYLDWALKMFNDKPLDLSKSEVKELREFVETSETITVLAKAQILNLISSLND